ncbi:MAG: tandem-95 repeat protein [Candidatus Competibacteraceae bacterium]|nr:MAG: tandem-95 repeat protein [Candidatus Competibacteraceae bacterium]
MNTQRCNAFEFGMRIAALACIGLLLALLPDWNHPAMAQASSSVSLTPSSYGFGSVAVGGSGTTSFTVHNGLLADIDLGNAQTSAPFSAISSCGRLAPGASCTIQVNFVPTASGNFSGTLSIVWSQNDLPPPPPGEPAPGGTLTSSLSGTATSSTSPPTPPPALVATPDSATTAQGVPVVINVLANDSGGTLPLTVISVTTPVHGTATTNGSTVTYTPNAGYSGADSFGYTIRDSSGQTASSTVSVTVTPSTVPTPPPALVATPDSATTAQGVPVVINVLANDSGGTLPLTVISVTTPVHGTATTNGSTVTYTPNAGYSGADSFGYTIRDSSGQTASAGVSVTITPVTTTPPALIVTPDSVTVVQGSSVTINVLANVSGGTPPLSVVSVTSPAHGTATTNGSTVTYTPNAGYSGTDSFSYTIQDSSGQTASTSISVTVKSSQKLLEDAANTPNAGAIARTINSICSNQASSTRFRQDCNTLINSVNDNAIAVGSALDQITPSAAGDAPAISQTNVQTQMVNIRARLFDLRSGISGANFDQLRINRGSLQHGGWSLSGQDLRHLLASLGGGGPSAELNNDFGPFGIFASGTVNLGSGDSSTNQAGFDFRTFALTVGTDYRFTDQFVLGSALSYVANDNDIDSNGGQLDTHGYSLTLYGTYFYDDRIYLDGMIDYGWNDYDQQRNVAYQLPDADIQQRFGSNYGGQQFFADLGVGYQFHRDQWTFNPEIRLSYLNLQVDSYQEHADADGPGSAWAVAIDEQKLQSLTSRLGGKINYLIDQPWGALQPQVEFNWLHEFKDNANSITGHFVEGATGPDSLFYLLTDTPTQNYFELGLGLSARFNKGPNFLIQYRTLLNYDVQQNAITAQLRWEF